MVLFSSPYRAFLSLTMVLASGTPSGSTSKCPCQPLVVCFLFPSAAMVCTGRTTSSTALECMVVSEAVAAATLAVFHWRMSGRRLLQQSCRRQPCRLLMRQTSRRQCCRLIMRRSCRRQCLSTYHAAIQPATILSTSHAAILPATNLSTYHAAILPATILLTYHVMLFVM